MEKAIIFFTKELKKTKDLNLKYRKEFEDAEFYYEHHKDSISALEKMKTIEGSNRAYCMGTNDGKMEVFEQIIKYLKRI